ncbi:MAG: N-succinylarginine dihydrolase [Panacagrimonas sp.]
MNDLAKNAAIEANFDGLVGPTHSYAGLAKGNAASARHARKMSNPQAAAHQGLAKMRRLADLGLAQGVLPPQERPHMATLRALGFSGKDADILARARRDAPGLLAAVSSASAMWTANAATVSPAADTADGRIHFTPANLASHLHRSLEPATTARVLRATFPDSGHFVHHAPLPASPETADEGAANHTRLCAEHGLPGLELFVYGRGGEEPALPTEEPARQSLAASEAVARLHGLDESRRWFAQQSPVAIDLGVFHNDVIAVGNREVLLHHEHAFVEPTAIRDWIKAGLEPLRTPVFIEVSDAEVSLAEAVSSYLFNSQLLSLPGGGMLLACSQECRENPRVWRCIQNLIVDPRNPIHAVEVFDLRQSMNNGGGPACLRLRVVVDEPSRAAVNPRSWITPERHADLCAWVDRFYRDRLVLDDLADPQLLDESRTALDRLTQVLGLGSLYDFQR